MAKRGKIVKLTPEQIRENNLLSEVKEMTHAIKIGIIPLNPTRKFELDERVRWGNHKEVYVRGVFEDGLYYELESIGVIRNRDGIANNEFHVLPWFEIYKYPSFGANTKFTQKEEFRINLWNSSIDSLLSNVYSTHAGTDFDIDYQRGHVWTMEDKIALIDSIFNHVDIGKFVFVQRPFSVEGKLREILDGKQRLTALCEFYEDRWKYRGFYFSELSFEDRHTFENHPITVGELQEPNKKRIYEAFIKLNTCGRPMDHKHIEKVEDLLRNLEK